MLRFRINGLIVMTLKAELARCILEQSDVSRLVRRVAFKALAFFRRTMRILEILSHTAMAFSTNPTFGSFECLRKGGRVTGCAFALCIRIMHDVALQHLPVTFAIDRAGLVGEDGPTHHGVFDLSYLRMIPGLVVMAPRHEGQLRDMMLTAAKYEEGPVAYRYPRGRGQGIDISAPPKLIEIGKGEMLHEPAPSAPRSVAILSIGSMAKSALGAAKILEEQGLGVAVADMRFLKPLDSKLVLELARNYDHLVTVEENVLAGGFGSGVIELLASHGVLLPVTTLGFPDAWIEQGSIEELLELHGLTPRGIADSILAKLPAQSCSQNLAGTA